jgi:hypothetical protein
LLDKEAVLSSFWNAAAGCDVAVVEGAMGLFDGAEDSSESGSTAQIAKWLHAPVILIIDCSTIARSIAAVIKGCQSFDPALSIPGVVLNKATSAMHAKSLSNAIDAANLGVTVLGGMLKVRRGTGCMPIFLSRAPTCAQCVCHVELGQVSQQASHQSPGVEHSAAAVAECRVGSCLHDNDFVRVWRP